MSDALRPALDAAGGSLRRAVVGGWLLPGLGTILLALAAVVAFARSGAGGLPLLTVITWGLVGMGAVAVALAAARARRRWNGDGVARRLEGLGAVRAGGLTTLREAPVAGTSDVLHVAAVERAVMQVRAQGHAALEADRVIASRRVRTGAVVLAAGALALVLARPLDSSARMVWQPWQAWSALTAPVRLSTTTPVVSRGDSARLEIRAWGQRRAVLRTRAPGEGWRETTVLLDADGRAVVTTPPLAAELVATAVAGGRTSAELRVAVRLPAFLGAFTVTAEYPAYLGLEPEVLVLEGDTLVLPAGTRLAVTGRATTPLARAALVGSGEVVLPVAGEAFTGGFIPTAAGAWQLALATADGAPLEGALPAFAVRVVPDAVPVVEIPVPGRDTIPPPSLQVPVVISLQDDHGLRTVALELQPGRGRASVRVAVPLPDGTTDRALLTTSLDLGALGLAPGDTLWYAAVATDNAPQPGVGRSRRYVLRVPTEAEQRTAARDATAATATGLDSLAAAARQAQRRTEDLARERARSDASRTGGGDDPLAAEAARRAEQAAEAQEAVERQAEALEAQVEELRQAAERAGTADSTLADQLAEIRDLLQQAMTPELREKLAELRQAAQELNADRTRDALRDLAQEQAKMRETLDRARELFQRAALETELAALAEAAQELAEAQREATADLERDPAAAAAREDALAAQADSLAASLEENAAKLPSEAAEAGLQRAADQARRAAEQMREAASAARKGQQQQAKAGAESAGETLEPLAEQIRTERKEMQEAMRAEVAGALERLLAETARILDRQLVVAEAYRRGAVSGAVRIEQGLLEEGSAKLFQQVLATAGKNALVSPRIATALATARNGMRGAIEATATATPNLGAAAEQAGGAVDALAVAAHALLRSKEDVEGAASGSGMAEAMQQMQQMAGQQGQLSQQGQGMMQQGEGGMEQMLQLAMQQRAIAQQLERLQAGGQMPGAGDLAREAKEISRQLEAGRLTPETAQRQERLFRRMLDAGRSLEGEERDEKKERQSEAATEAERRLPPALEARLRRGEGDVPLPGWEELQQLRPEERRRVLEYFRRLAAGGGT